MLCLLKPKKLTTDPLKLAKLSDSITDETLLETYNAAVTEKNERDEHERVFGAPKGYELGYILGKTSGIIVTQKNQDIAKAHAHKLEIMPSGKTRSQEQDIEYNVGSISKYKKKGAWYKIGKYVADIFNGFNLSIGTIGGLPMTGIYNMMGEQEKAQQIQGWIDAKYEKYGFNKPIEGNLLESG